ncbi:MAG: phosphodiesterase [Deltaproteobacteria bacterium]|nr:phosphodiesterase [Deltaproteobacteria bacterium]
MARARTLVIGLDCVPPELIFERYRDAMPNVTRLASSGSFGPLRSTTPPITVPAWPSMVTGRDPGELGLYGFRARQAGRRALSLVTSAELREKRVWDRLGEAGQRVAALFVPLTSPPKPVRGVEVSGFLWPGEGHAWAWPRSVEHELEARFGAYRADVARFGEQSEAELLTELRRMAEQHFAIAEYVLDTRDPDFLMMVEIGTDRLHHALWRHMDPAHPAHDPSCEWALACRDYYAYLDARIGDLVARAGPGTRTLLVSDHGARPMLGGVRINEWLLREGWLRLRGVPEPGTALSNADVDWSETRAWAAGGYYARVFLNREGCGPDACVPEADAARTLDQLRAALSAMPGPAGETDFVQVDAPEQLYAKLRGCAPDLMLTFGGLAYRALGELGGDVFSEHDARGPDGANHARDGFFVLSGAGVPARGRVDDAQILDITPTLLGLANVPAPSALRGRDLSR